ncbi:hypothetical protein NEIELOOT_00532 [Neisseria elongata subsp. glycolytica ATCC 29315]|uniref:Uncharacterized protein n=1 Tax=Neisseria elongata subsp. glycolytica ATCC 29315 TaxID=546263 RepID=D4DNA4_NEIEG|nr:hypothetical protein NEIELOOT_00532 [Neisseria elongata subsp. glycolytica ATCC 29315]
MKQYRRRYAFQFSELPEYPPRNRRIKSDCLTYFHMVDFNNIGKALSLYSGLRYFSDGLQRVWRPSESYCGSFTANAAGHCAAASVFTKPLPVIPPLSRRSYFCAVSCGTCSLP